MESLTFDELYSFDGQISVRQSRILVGGGIGRFGPSLFTPPASMFGEVTSIRGKIRILNLVL